MPYSDSGKYFWSRNSGDSWPVITNEIDRMVCAFVDESGHLATGNDSGETRRLLTNESVERIHALARELSLVSKEVEEPGDESYLIKQWTILGATAEVVLQVFLTVYIQDFNNEGWHHWQSFNNNAVMLTISEALNGLVNNGSMSADQRRSLLKEIRRTIKNHIESQPINRIMLNDLIGFYQKYVMCDANEKVYIDNLRRIQKNRNAIHVYLDREIGGAKEYRESLLLFGCMTDELKWRLPDISSSYGYDW